jgi:hypothetical protein
MRFRLGARKYQDCLILISNYDLLVFSAGSGSHPGEHSLSFFDYLDHTGTIFEERNQHPITDSCDIALSPTSF